MPLAHLCFPASASRGRRYPEPAHPYRNEFQRDRDRVIHARAFRRLEAKTQVFAPGLSDHFRNRLTHTIEVSQMSRTVAKVLELNEELTEALALAHDIGHPPFAHAGEEELNRQMQRHGASFDHNQHALRLVENFEQRYARFPGLNLTFEVREGIVKHSRDFEPGEMPLFDEYLPGLRPPLEAQLIDLTDEIAYNTADLDDAFHARLFKFDDLLEAVPRYAQMWEEIDTQYPGASDRSKFQETLRMLINWLVAGLISGTYAAAQEAAARDVEDVRRYPSRLVRFTPETQHSNGQLKQFLRKCVYMSEELAQERRKSAGQIAELFQFFVEHPDRLPENYREEAEGEPVYRVVCDYIAGMTDSYFRKVYQVALASAD